MCSTRLNAWVADGHFSDDGQFQIPGVAAGTYRVRIDTGGSVYAPEWWQDAPTWATATPITVTNGAVSTINPQLNMGGSIAGKVTALGGAVLADDGWVYAYHPDGEYPVGFSGVSEDGSFQIDRLTTGRYLLQFGTVNGQYSTEWWQDVEARDLAAAVGVTDAQTTSAINAELALAPIQGGEITGTVTGPGGSPLDANTWGGVSVYNAAGDYVRGGVFNSAGTFTIKGLDPGAYTLEIDPGYGSRYATEWWQNAATRATATPVTVTSNTTVTVNPQLDLTGSITGTVTGPDGAPLTAGRVERQCPRPRWRLRRQCLLRRRRGIHAFRTGRRKLHRSD